MKARTADNLGVVLVPGDHHDDRPAGDPGRRPGQALAVQEQLLLAAQELGAVVGEGLQLGDQAGACLVHLRPHRVGVELATGRDGLVAHVDRGARGCGRSHRP